MLTVLHGSDLHFGKPFSEPNMVIGLNAFVIVHHCRIAVDAICCWNAMTSRAEPIHAWEKASTFSVPMFLNSRWSSRLGNGPAVAMRPVR